MARAHASRTRSEHPPRQNDGDVLVRRDDVGCEYGDDRGGDQRADGLHGLDDRRDQPVKHARFLDYAAEDGAVTISQIVFNMLSMPPRLTS